MTLNTKRSNVPHIHVRTTPDTQISLVFTLRLAISKIFAIFHFPIGYNVKFQSFLQTFKFEISKAQWVTFVRIVTRNIQKKLAEKES